jgi:hypothetical protein
MKEPKTLKDLEEITTIIAATETYNIGRGQVKVIDLKAEAKQWIEYLTQPESPEENIWIADWIKMFFNTGECFLIWKKDGKRT